MKRWYVAQVYAGYEEIVKDDLLRRIKQRKDDLFGEVLVPSAQLKSFFSLGEEPEDERLFPGYVLVEMEKSLETISFVASTPKLLKFLGGKDPAALTKREIERILSQVRGDVVVSTTSDQNFIEGVEIDIAGGPFAGFVGIVDKVDEEGEKLTVMVSIFGRLTPVELTFDQVKR
jgi:transcriptional antiterminator NusG